MHSRNLRDQLMMNFQFMGWTLFYKVCEKVGNFAEWAKCFMENIQIFCSLYPLFGGRNVCKHADYSFLTHRFPAFFGCYVLFEYFCIRILAIAGNKGMIETLIVSTLIVGVALGFRISLADNLWRAAIPMTVLLTLAAFLGVMLGRSQKELRARRYTLFAALFLLAFALKGAFWG